MTRPRQPSVERIPYGGFCNRPTAHLLVARKPARWLLGCRARKGSSSSFLSVFMKRAFRRIERNIIRKARWVGKATARLGRLGYGEKSACVCVCAETVVPWYFNLDGHNQNLFPVSYFPYKSSVPIVSDFRMLFKTPHICNLAIKYSWDLSEIPQNVYACVCRNHLSIINVEYFKSNSGRTTYRSGKNFLCQGVKASIVCRHLCITRCFSIVSHSCDIPYTFILNTSDSAVWTLVWGGSGQKRKALCFLESCYS